jgi:hypothetical protein
MNKYSKYTALALAAVALSACDDLDTEYKGYYVTEDTKDKVVEENPDMIAAGVNSIFASFSSYGSVSSSHYDFGYPAIMMGLDCQGTDYVTSNNDYNHFSSWIAYSAPTSTGTPTAMMWYHMYDQIYTENAVISKFKDASSEEDMFYLANAYAARAFNYWVLAQTYQFNYVNHESSPCVPLITEANNESAETEGCPRSTVQEVYDQIMSDINNAIDLFSQTTYTREEAINSKPKRMIDLSVAYGLRARFNLTMHKYADAASDAQLAINNFSGSPYTRSDVSKPGFNNLTDNSWMWGIAIAETDRVVTTGIINFPSHSCSFSYGYVTVGAWKYCNSSLYNQISSRDVRKGWFLDENLQSTNLTKAQQAYLDSYSTIPAYTNVKFDSYNSVLNQSTNASDIPLMRVEEMYYILAEGLAMSGRVEEGRTTFENFIQRYRNSKYTCYATTAEALQEEIYQDRRVEFWGEGLSFFDIMRLNKPVDRRNANYPSDFCYYIPSVTENSDAAKVLIYCIPNAEIVSNPQISTSDNNPAGSRPTPQT